MSADRLRARTVSAIGPRFASPRLSLPAVNVHVEKFLTFLLQNRGVYMLRMDSDHVIDATLTGGPAR